MIQNILVVNFKPLEELNIKPSKFSIVTHRILFFHLLQLQCKLLVTYYYFCSFTIHLGVRGDQNGGAYLKDYCEVFSCFSENN